MTDTDRIDLDELTDDATDDEPDARRGDWFWQGEGDPDAEPDAPERDPAESGVSRLMEQEAEAEQSPATDPDADGDDPDTDDPGAAGDDADPDAAGDDADSGATDDADEAAAIPRVPRENADKPVGVPSGVGGAGAGAGPGSAMSTDEATEATESTESGDGSAPADGPNHEAGTNAARKAVAAGAAEAKGPHGGGADDMTMALSFRAMSQLSDPQLTVAKAREWADWVGIVGEVEAPVINKFQREHRVDADFFNGTGTGPAERLANVGETSMFYAKRMVLVGTEADRWIAEEAGWEFVPFETAAEKAGWDHET
ncbi:hypothetical protein GCM10027435_05570 [Haloparvum alkalitolerans]|uniref:DUF7124 domain-containing protein n=1 Tax=Haloparvum alkalitolerans TaxID=1042953 RepID=UPI003CF9F696